MENAVSSPIGSGRNPATKRILVHFEAKVKHVMVLMSCIVSAASYRTAADLLYEGTNNIINYYVDKNSGCVRDCV